MSGSVDGQPAPEDAYNTSGNPIDLKPAESSLADRNARVHPDGVPVATRGLHDVADAEPALTSRARGVHGAPPGEETKGVSQSQLDSEALDAAQMAAPGEGDISAAVERKSGASGAMPGLESDLDRKKAEQEKLRQARDGQGDEAAPQREVNIQAALGGGSA